MRGVVDSGLRWAVGPLDRSPSSRRVVAQLLGRYHRARGANPVLVAEAVDRADQITIAGTRATMRWARALEGRGPMPARYRPDRLLTSPAARAEAVRLLDRNLELSDDPDQRRQRAMLEQVAGPPDPASVDRVRDLLDDRLARRKGVADVDLPAGTGDAFAVLIELVRALETAGHRPFLVSGTLLGVVRDGTLLAHDYDIDVGLAPGDGTAAGVGDTLRAVGGFTVTVEEGRVWGTHWRGVAFDVFLHHEADERWWHGTGAHRWWNTPFELAETVVEGHGLRIPADTDTYLEENYGHWRRPTTFFDKNTDTPNLEFRDTAEALYYLQDVVLDATGPRPDRYRAEAAVRELAVRFDIDLRHHFGPSPLLDDPPD